MQLSERGIARVADLEVDLIEPENEPTIGELCGQMVPVRSTHKDEFNANAKLKDTRATAMQTLTHIFPIDFASHRQSCEGSLKQTIGPLQSPQN